MYKIYLLLILFASCQNNFLDTVSTDTYNEANWWQNENQVISSLNGCYASLMNSVISGVDKLAEESISPNGYSVQHFTQVSLGAHDAGNTEIFELKWNKNYQGIGRVNVLLDNLGQVEMDDELKDRVIGEARFLRAYFYSNLVSYFGGVPLILETPNIEQHSSQPRNSKEEVIDQIIRDLDLSVSLLPLSYSGSDIGRATKGAALGLKARVLLYESKWEEAASVAQDVINLGVYNLFPDYRDLFLPENENNEEILFDVQYTAPDFFNAFDRSLLLATSPAPTLDLLNSYLMLDGLAPELSNVFDQQRPYNNRDPRLIHTIILPGSFYGGEVINEERFTSTGMAFKKYTSYRDSVPISGNINERTEINFIILRYADILLMYAEAMNELKGPDETIIKVLNSIRRRAGMPDVSPDLSQSEMRDLIRKERRIELACEGLYYHDIKRWKIAEDVLNKNVLNFNGEVIQKRSFNSERDYLWPIHEITIQENSALKQNPGY